MLLKKTIIGLVGVGLVSTSLLASAAALTITNNTWQDSTTKTNGSPKCSSQLLGSYGVTKAKSSNTIYETLLKLACAGHFNDCIADVYMNNSCLGVPVATVHFNLTTGLMGLPVIYDPAYSLGGGGFNLSINGGHFAAKVAK